jgi:hypothetical protein
MNKHLATIISEPGIDELLSDTGIRDLMKSDNVHETDLRNLLRQTAEQAEYARHANRFFE